MDSLARRNEPIAIVGSSCRLPGGAISPALLWKLLASPRDVAVEMHDRFNTFAFYHPDDSHHGTTSARQAYLLRDDIKSFDASFFSISPNEADAMDPQHRLLLETVYEALEAGGHTMKSLQGSDTAVYTGNVTVEYFDSLLQDLNTVPTYFTTGTSRAIMSNRISYFFDWHGPSMTIDTACSSSMIAVHQAVKALQNNESRVAVAGGTNLILSPDSFVVESKMKMLSPTSRGRMWDKDADGYARGEGVAAIVLKRLSDAMADGDHIECLIRGTGANQDGHSQGLTVPSTDAQTELILQTYARAGLHPESDSRDRPQFFEAHGTGTKAGDPKEAAAIHRCFGHPDNDTPLYVGSVKTILGHAEATAGLAGLLKGMLMIQHGSIAPNLLFHHLNPDIEPYYKGVEVPTRLLPWPELPPGVPRRISVNSFGFGGTNAHAILEQFRNEPATTADARIHQHPLFTPFVFSAASETSLVAQLLAYSRHLRTHQDINASDLAWTLQTRRDQFATRLAFSAPNIDRLASEMEAALASAKQNQGGPGGAIGVRVSSKATSTNPRLLGIFTGQGAQWARMGAQLILSSDYVKKRFLLLEDSLATLPLHHRPKWHIVDELLAEADESRLGEAALAQPLCTAVQIVLVDMLHAAGITFAAVVGHSSGEIAAAYAAGFISAHDAIRVAYYRGSCVRPAESPTGSMLAAGLSRDEAEDFINQPAFKGRLAVAAHNSSASVTLSGDADSILDAKKILAENKKFARLLRVNTAYHSHHMLACSAEYVGSLQTCGIRVNRGRSASTCAWFSSVYPSETPMSPVDELRDVYWRDNMTNTVLFADAVKNAVSGGEINLVLELGPHPALKGPATQNISDVIPGSIPYSGVLMRGKDDVEAFSDALGFVWTQIGAEGVDFKSFEDTMTGQSRRPKLVVGLPSYQWDHTRPYWNESRIAYKRRQPSQRPHEILGSRCPDSNAHDMRWLNVLKLSELPWLEGHKIQGQVLLPATGYVAMALEAARHLTAGSPVKLFELSEFSVPRAITFEETGDTGVETLVTLTGISHQPDQTVTARFSCYSLPVDLSGSNQEMKVMASGNVTVLFGDPTPDVLSSALLEDYNMSTYDPDHFYSALSKLGYGYSGSFRAVSSMKRRLNQSIVLAHSYEYKAAEADHSEYLVHPALLDVALQTAFFAYSAPGDGRLWSLQIPTFFGGIRVNPEVCALLPTSSTPVPVCTVLSDNSERICACIDLFSEDGTQCMVQIEDLTLQPLEPPTEDADRLLYTCTKYEVAAPDGASFSDNLHLSEADIELAHLCERVRHYYMRKWEAEISEEEWKNSQSHHQHLHHAVQRELCAMDCGQQPAIQGEWSTDSRQEIMALVGSYPECIDLKLISAVGEHLPAAVRGQTSILEHMLEDNMLDDLYAKGIALPQYNSVLAGMVKQIIHRYPRAKILEIGAGTGGATKAILGSIGKGMSSYTFTDISRGVFGKAAEVFKAYSDKMLFKTLDIEKAPSLQGYEPHTYDIVIAANVLHATASLSATLQNTRQLLRPGGYLLLLEITSRHPGRITSVMGGLPGWWLGVDDGRKYSPTVTAGEWHSVLRHAGFSGIDTITPDVDDLVAPYDVFASQAVDEKVQFLRRPLSSSPSLPLAHIESLVVLRNKSLRSSRTADEVAEYLEPFCDELTVLDGLPTDADADALNPMSTFINLADIDNPIFQDISNKTVGGLRAMLDRAVHILWVTEGAQVDQPYHMASVTFGRTIRNEEGHISLHYLDFSGLQAEGTMSRAIAEHLLRHRALEEWEEAALGDEGEAPSVLWSREPEMWLDAGRLKIPRLVPQVDQNLRFNSNRRVTTKAVDISKSNVEILVPANSPPCIIDAATHAAGKNTNNSKAVRVRSSSLLAINVAVDTFLFLGIATEQKSAGPQKVVVLVSQNCCETIPVVSAATSGEANALPADALLVAVASELLAASLVQSLPPGAHILLLCSDADRSLAVSVSRRAATKAIRVTILCDADSAEKVQLQVPTWVRSSARAPRHELRRLLLRIKPTHFLDATSTHTNATAAPGGFGRRISRDLPTGCRLIKLATLAQHQPLLPLSCDYESLTRRLEDAMHGAMMLVSSWTAEQLESFGIPLDKFAGDSMLPYSVTSAVHWPLEGPVTVRARPLHASSFFSADKTYLLVGLAGRLGQSLCQWMISNGAGCVCLASRRPNLDRRWLQSLEKTGSSVKVFAVDITNVQSLEVMVKEIRATCHPIAGVVNGAMVLRDAAFSNMSADAVREVLAPKVDGSNHLDRVFHDDELDFFVLLSSSVGIVGNPGQSIYAATSGYVNALARQRRRRGLAGSSLDIGRIAGVGYVETAGQHVVDQLNKFGLTAVDERALQQAFAETIQLGYSHPEDIQGIPQAVVTIGVPTISEDKRGDVPWANNPFFSHCIVETARSGADEDDRSCEKTLAPAIQQLAQATTQGQALEILKQCFSTKLVVILKQSEQAIDHNAPLVELGVDSLVAVEIRSWFLKELKVEIPVLKVMGGATLAELCQAALDKLPRESLASIGQQSDEVVSGIQSTTVTTPPTSLAGVSGHRSPSKSAGTPPLSDASLDRQLERSWSMDSTAPSSPGSVRFPERKASTALSSPVLTPEPKASAEAQLPSQKFVKSVPISLGQSRWWFLKLMLDDPKTFNVAVYYRVDGNLRIGALERAVRLVANRHEALRTCFIEDPADPAQAYQKVLAGSEVRLERKKINSVEDVAGEFTKFENHEFDLASGRLVRILLLTLSSSCHYFLLSYHHIIMDGISYNVFLTELEKAYMGQSLGPTPQQYPDVSLAQRQSLESGGMSAELAYWRTVFPPDKQPPVLPLLPMARNNSRMPMQEFGVHQVRCRIDATIAARLRMVAKAQRATPFHFYIAAFKAMLFRFTDVQELTIGIADAARNDDDVMGCIGFFLNLLSLRFSRQLDQSFSDAVVEARETAFQALANSRLPFDVLLSEFNIIRSSEHSPFFQAFFDYRQAAHEKLPFGNCSFEFQELHPGRTAYDITLDVTENDIDAVVMLRVQKSLYDLTAANLLLETYVHFLEVLSSDPSTSLESTPLFSQRQRSRAVEVGRGPTLTSDWPPTLPHRIDQVVSENPDRVALEDGIGNVLTYSEMANRIQQISAELLKEGVTPGECVLVFQQASVDWVCSMLAIMRIGAIYVPLDLRNPMPRLAAVANDCNPRAVLAHDSTMVEAPQLNTTRASIINTSATEENTSSHVANVAKASSPAAVLYTSGSTGTPKGIVVTHFGLRNEIEGYTKTWGLGKERALQQSSFTFNHSSDQIFTGLANGGMVYIVSSSQRGDPLEITRIVQEHSITYTKATPSEYLLWAQYGRENLIKASTWRFAFGGGEPLTIPVTDEFANLGRDLPQLRFFNSYGPTEISISSHKMEIEYRNHEILKDMGRIPCGYSLPNYHTYVVDDQLRPQPVGMPGELCIGGAGVSLGYINNKDLTDRQFVPNPFASSDDLANGWTRVYRTSDIGHLREDGAMVFHNRIAGDTQVKIRGLRIELSDIETNIVAAARGALKEAVVTLREGDPELLVAHVVFASQHNVGITDKTAFLERLLRQLALPQYMIPIVAIPLDKLPLTNHSKVDRRAIRDMPLPARKQTNSEGDEAEELSETMVQLKRLWRNVLGKDFEELGLSITPSTSFFTVGGNSLLTVRLQAQIRQTFDTVIPLVELLGANTLGAMARKIEESSQVRVINWEEETTPPPVPAFLADIPTPRHTGRQQTEEPMTIVVTGATGQLGRSLLPVLAAQPAIGKIHCVAVRDRPANSPRQVPCSAKIISHAGDLSLPRLGLSVQEFRGLASDVDVILHFGGVHPFWDNYHALRATNVHSTRELVQLAAPRHVPIHYISTSGVLPRDTLLDPRAATVGASAAAYVPSVDGTEGYVASRWASERILERSAASLGVPSTVYRFLPSSCGRSQAHSKDVLDECVRFVDKLGLMPDTTNWAGRFDLIPVDELVEWLCKLALCGQQQEGRDDEVGTTRFVHYESTISLTVEEFAEYLEKERGDKGLNRISLHQWMGRSRALGFRYLITTQDAVVGGAGLAGQKEFRSRR